MPAAFGPLRSWNATHAGHGGGGIRTRGPRERTPVFKTGAFDRSATPPDRRTVCPMPETAVPLLVVQRPADHPEHAALVRRARALAALGLAWHVIEAAVAIAAGVVASS